MTNKEIKDLMGFFDDSDISKVKIKNGEFSIELQKGLESAVVVKSPAVVVDESVEVDGTTQEDKMGESIKSPMVGTFYTSPAPGADVFVKAGSVVKKGQSIGIIEAMKIMNEIEAEFDCRIIKVLLEDGQPVEYDMPLFEVERV